MVQDLAFLISYFLTFWINVLKNQSFLQIYQNLRTRNTFRKFVCLYYRKFPRMLLCSSMWMWAFLNLTIFRRIFIIILVQFIIVYSHRWCWKRVIVLITLCKYAKESEVCSILLIQCQLFRKITSLALQQIYLNMHLTLKMHRKRNKNNSIELTMAIKAL